MGALWKGAFTKAQRRIALTLALALAGHGASIATQSDAQVQELIATVVANGVSRGDLNLLLGPGGDFLVPEADIDKLNLKPRPDALQRVDGRPYYSLKRFGATRLDFDEATLSLTADFPADAYERTTLNLASTPPALPPSLDPGSYVLNYRASASRTSGVDKLQLRLTSDFNITSRGYLFRQEAQYRDDVSGRYLARGATQIVRDNRGDGTRLVIGDTVTRAGSLGTAFTGAGVSYARLFTMTPELIRQPTVSKVMASPGPSQVEVSVDGSPVYRATVGPGPIALDNLYWYGGTRNVRITLTDASGRRQVFEEPYLFTDSVLAKGLHEFAYFAGKRSVLGTNNSYSYLEPAWQAFHRYGLTDSLTVEGDAEGTQDFANAGISATFRQALLGLFTGELLASHDRAAGQAAGLGGRYTYVAPRLTAYAAQRRFSDGFTTFATQSGLPPLRRENRFGFSVPAGRAVTMGADALWARDTLGPRSTISARVSSALSPRTTLQAEYAKMNGPFGDSWRINVFLRYELDGLHWVASNLRQSSDGPSVDMETGRQLNTGEGFGYRVIASRAQASQQDINSVAGTATLNLRQAALELNGASALSGGGSSSYETAVAGAVVGVGDHWGLTRSVTDGFALAKLGAAQPGVEIFLNNQSQGRTDEGGYLFIPQVSAFNRQEVSLDDRGLPLDYAIPTKRLLVSPGYRTGALADFAARLVRAYVGHAVARHAGKSAPVGSRAIALTGPQGSLRIETSPEGEFYLENAAPGRYRGRLFFEGASYSCTVTLPESQEVVTELREGINCE